VSTPRITWSHDVGAAAWIAHRLSGPSGSVGSLVPAGFGAYGRILHPEGAAGTLEAELADVLASVAAAFTTTARRCWFGVWDGYGWLYPSRDVAGLGTLALVPAVGDDVPRLQLPRRDFLLYTAPISAVTALAGYPTHQTPNLWWPDDHAWCVVTDIDLSSTYVGGTPAFIQQLHAEPRLEITPVSLADPLG
jgi:hypothetical protein